MALRDLVNLDTQSQYETVMSKELTDHALRMLAAQAVTELSYLDWKIPVVEEEEDDSLRARADRHHEFTAG